MRQSDGKENGARHAKPNTGLQPEPSCVSVGKHCHLCATPRLGKRHITSCNYKMPEEKKERKRAAISAARRANKPTEKSALMSTVYAAGCVGWIPPHPPRGRDE